MPTPINHIGLAPVKAHPTDAGYDLVSTADKTLAPGCWSLIPTGLHIGLPPNTVGYVCPRSGLAVTHGITVLNAPGDRIAQLIIHHTVDVDWRHVTEFNETQRGNNGHGSTGA